MVFAQGLTLSRVGQFLAASWPLLVPLLLGLVGVYLLMPQAGRSRPLWGTLAAAAALVLGGILLVHADMALPETILFYAFSAVAVTGGVLLITQRNPVHAALSFALVVLATCGLFLLQGAPFLMASTIIVYAGAIIVTFLFVIMLAQQHGFSSADQRSREPFLATLAGFILLAALLLVLERSYSRSELDDYLDRFARAGRAEAIDEARAILGDVQKIREDLLNKIPNPKAQVPTELMKIQWRFWEALERLDTTGNRLGELKHWLAEAHEAGLDLRVLQGTVRPATDIPLSANSGTPPNRQDPDRRLPARNVAGLGRTLFTDYLLPVELAGVLLLVATIGAIVIAGRHKEGA